MNEVDRGLKERYGSMRFGQLTDEETKNLLHEYIGPSSLSQEQVDEILSAMYHIKEGELAPDAAIFTMDGKPVTLYSLFSSEKPTVLNFGKKNLEIAMGEQFKDSVKFLTIYISEAHASDEWQLDSNDELGVCYRQPKTLEARLKVARQFYNDFQVESAVFIDSMENEAMTAYAAHPERLYVIKDNKIAFRGGVGPFQYSVEDLVAWLQENQ